MTFIALVILIGIALIILSRVIERERDLEELEYKIRSLTDEMEHIYDEQVEEATKAWQSWRDYSESE